MKTRIVEGLSLRIPGGCELSVGEIMSWAVRNCDDLPNLATAEWVEAIMTCCGKVVLLRDTQGLHPQDLEVV